MRIGEDFDKQDGSDSAILFNKDHFDRFVSYFATGNIHLSSGVS